MHNVWQGKRILVTGGAGFIGSRVTDALRLRGVSERDIRIVRSQDCDLRLQKNCRDAVSGCSIILHLAAPTGGISFSRAHPASQYLDCALINLHLLEAAREAGVEKVVVLGNLLAYPAAADSPLREEQVFDGPIATTHLGVGLAKRDMIVLAEMYYREYGLNVINVLSANAYGPGDRFDREHSHVIPATIAKCFRDDDLVVWGDGSPTRDFLYVDDVAEGFLLAAERLAAPRFVNIASGREVSIAELVRLIAEMTGFRGRITFDLSKGGGDPRRVASTCLAGELIGFTPRIPLSEGLRRTIDWFKRANLESARQ